MYVEVLNGLRSGPSQALLLEHDKDVAERVQAQGCQVCGGKLHCAHFQRKPRGGVALTPEVCVRLSYCCSEKNCRKRTTPPSLRFLGPQLYLAVVVVLIAALRCGETPERLSKLQELVGVSRQTVQRWLQWWREVLPTHDLWRARGGALRTRVDLQQMPQSLLEQFTGSLQEQVLALLRFLAPLTGGKRCGVPL